MYKVRNEIIADIGREEKYGSLFATNGNRTTLAIVVVIGISKIKTNGAAQFTIVSHSFHTLTYNTFGIHLYFRIKQLRSCAANILLRCDVRNALISTVVKLRFKWLSFSGATLLSAT